MAGGVCRRVAPAAVTLIVLLFIAGATGAADPHPPESYLKSGRTLWQLGEDGGLKLAGASPPVAPQPKFWTFNTPCKPGMCSELCKEKTGWYDAGKCFDASSGRRYCKCWKEQEMRST